MVNGLINTDVEIFLANFELSEDNTCYTHHTQRNNRSRFDFRSEK